ncbi:MAG: alcohol dehydrogenase [Dehalococcoidia bacterium]|nr:alcohol dehydrogenase [Dehalococcoidia bacterium]
MTDLEYLDLDDLLSLIRALSIGPVRDLGLLDSATARPRSTAFGTEAYPTIEGKAAALLHSLARNHALIDGNKRLAWLATATFLDINDRGTALGDDEIFGLVMDVSAGLDDIAEIAQRLGIRPS